MNVSRLVRIVAGVFLACAIPSVVLAQMSAEKVAAIDQTLQAVKARYDKMPANQRMMLDGIGNAVHMADVWHRMGTHLADPAFLTKHPAVNSSASQLQPAGSPIIPVSAAGAANDLNYSALAGFTQSETSSARCGNNVVVGFNDSGSVFETPYYFTGTGGEGLSGYAYSADGGKTFTDGGPMDPGPGLGNFLAGDPHITCADANTFYYTQIFLFKDSGGNQLSGVALSTSTDGGKTFGPPVAAIGKDYNQHFLDKPWSAVDPTNPKNIYISYTDFDSSTRVLCGVNKLAVIEFVSSHDGGLTWSAPVVAAAPCDGLFGEQAVSGSQLAVSSKGVLDIAWVNLGTSFPYTSRSLQFASYSGGKVSSAVTIDALKPAGDSYSIQGNFRDFLELAMAVDHSGGPSDGNIYVTWADGRDKVVPDLFPGLTNFSGEYAYADVLLRTSFDGGLTWGASPTKVNSDFQGHVTAGHDHYQPGIAVDKTGTVLVCWYDRRNDSENFSIQRYCGTSSNSGQTFTDFNTGLAAFAPTHTNDEFINPYYMGDYDQPSADFLNQNAGFFSSFQSQGKRGNADVVGFRF